MEFNYEKCSIFEFPNEANCFSVGYLKFIRNKQATTILKPWNEIFKLSWHMCSIKSPRQMLKMKSVDYKSVPAKIIAVGNYIHSIFPENLESKKTKLEKIARIKLNNESKRKS